MGRFLDAAEIVLRREKRAMRCREITDAAISQRLLEFCNGKTPHQTMKAKLSVDIKSLGVRSRFKRSGKGFFALRELNAVEYLAPPIRKVVKPSEDVLVFPTKILKRVGYFNGISQEFERYAMALLAPENTTFLRRIDAESNESYKQLISYVIIGRDDGVLRFIRGSYTSVTAYLKGQYCIGFGGHVQSQDVHPLFREGDSGYRNSVYRELHEELSLPKGSIPDDRLRMVGALNDDSSALGRVHFAFVFYLDLTGLDSVPPTRRLKREKSINQLRWIPIGHLGSEFERYEYWSKLCIRSLFGKRIIIPCRVQRVKKFSLRKHSKTIVIAGGIGSGKTEASRLLQRKFGFHLVSSGHIMQDILGVSIKSIGRQRFQNLALDHIKSAGGVNDLASTIYKKIRTSGASRNVVDGIRNRQTLDQLRGMFDDNLTLIYVESTVDNAFSFFQQREGKGTVFEEFLELIHHPVEREVDQFIRLANVVIYNHGDKKSYLETVENYFKEELT